MLTLRFTFPAGRYHGNPWDRHVNEGEVAWPPDPWRILRALIATWHHKVKPLGHHDEATLAVLIDTLAESLPAYTLPKASHSHTRHYLPQWKAGDTSLVLDAFAAVDRDSPMYVSWPDLDLPGEQVALLDDLLAGMGYLGRAESWVEASRVDEHPTIDCAPGHQTVDQETGEIFGEVVHLFAPTSAAVYTARRAEFLADKRLAKRLKATLPETLLGALSLDTSDLQKQGWSQPPASEKIAYTRPLNALRAVRSRQDAKPPAVTTARFMLVRRPATTKPGPEAATPAESSKARTTVLPRVEDTVRIGELVRKAVMSKAGHRFGKDAIPASLSGHGLEGTPHHQHLFILPWDSDDDGRIDRIVLHVPDGVSGDARDAIEQLRRIFDAERGEWGLALEGIGDLSAGGELCLHSAVWESVTPYLHPWHAKKRFDAEAQLRRECEKRGLPEIVELTRLDHIEVRGLPREPRHFRRYRERRDLMQPDRHGSFWRIRFAIPVEGPIALGFGCHFGLGLFRPVAMERDIAATRGLLEGIDTDVPRDEDRV
ncbi:MAG: type I-U CRISPR-associated protein Cas5/Cas6 [Gammaproteobacteria bacterium]|nr:type I-U CRISPR-associated protein Cas5/Cas6 [Gammaproteobacteria bacterium]MCP5135262.1 type I-U CRISPR-associated protein Cas5/Cas6 [Gammaproteobacteria bacterium]